MRRPAAPLAAALLLPGVAALAGCDGGTVVIANGNDAAPGAARPAAPRAAAARPAPRRDRREPPAVSSADPREAAPPAETFEQFGGPGPAYVDTPGADDPAAAPGEQPGRPSGSLAGMSRFGAAAPLTVAAAVEALSSSTDSFARQDALQALAAAPIEEDRRAAVNDALNRTLMASLERSGSEAADHIAAMMHWGVDPAAFRRIGEAAVLSGGPWAGREVLRRAALTRDDAAVHALTPLLRDRWVGREAVEAVKRMGEKAEPAVLPLLADGDAAVRRDAAALLGLVGGPAGAEALLQRSKAEREAGLARQMRSARADILARLRAEGR